MPTNYPNGVKVEFHVFEKLNEAATTVIFEPPPINPSQPGSPPTLDPDFDPPTEIAVTPAQLGTRDAVRCTCVVSLTGINQVDAPTPPLVAKVIDIGKGKRHTFRLDAAQIPSQPSVRAFDVIFESISGM
jgi:hypothetical protein